ncbi:hypothetical protein H8D91_01495 [archaeon]|nr:hypothetical protein [archaeon]
MNKKQILLITSFILILFLIIFTQSFKDFDEGEISNIKISTTRTILNLKNNEMDFISFDKIENIEKCNKVKIYGKEELYKNKKQILIDKIICLK